MKLNTLNKDGHKYIAWCGPSALAIVTGRTLRYCHQVLALIAGKEPRYLKGVYNYQMHTAFNKMGYDLWEVELPLNLTLRQYIDEHQVTADFRSVMLINVTNHYVVAHRGLVCDNKEPEPRPPYSHNSGRKRINKAWVVKRRAR